MTGPYIESQNPNRQICWPEFSAHPPPEFANRLAKIRKDVWLRMQAGLYLMATTGWSVVQELMLPLAERFRVSPRADSMHRIFREYLREAGLIEYCVLPYMTQTGLAVVRLAEIGKSICSSWGWQVCSSDWEKLIDHHAGNEQLRHTAMVLDFAWQARRRGYWVIVLPMGKNSETTPDIYVERGLDRAYVEVERGKDTPGKWFNLNRLQGFVAVCALTNNRRRSLVRNEIKPLGIPGVATDLKSLSKMISPTVIGSLWLDRW